MELGYLPSFCTACYRSGRTGEKFMEVCKSQHIHNFCHPNAILTLKEYLEDYASDETKKLGLKLIQNELETFKESQKVKDTVVEDLVKIEAGQRDFKFQFNFIIPKFKTLAKQTHNKYGISNKAARFDTL